MATKTIPLRVNAIELFRQTAEQCQSYQVNVGLALVIANLTAIANRACELGDPALLECLENLNLVKKTEG